MEGYTEGMVKFYLLLTGIDAVYSVAIAGGTATKIIDGGANARISLNGVN